MKHNKRKYLKWVLFSLLCVVFSAAGIFACIQTPWAKKRIAALISARMSNEAYRLEIRELTGLVPFSPAAERITLADGKGTFLRLRNISLNWSPFSLLGERIKIRRIEADELMLERLPPAAGAAAPKEKRASPSGVAFPDLPKLRIQKLHFPHNEFREGVVGENIVVALNGSLRSTSRSSLAAAVELERIDRDGFKGQFKFRRRADRHVRVLCEVSAPPDGVLQNLPDMPLQGNIRAKLEGEGSLEKWEGRLAVVEDDTAVLNSVFQLDLAANAPMFDAEGTFRPPRGVLTEAQRNFIGGGESAGFELKGSYHRQRGEVRVEAGAITLNAASLEYSGTLDIGKRSVDIAYVLDIPELTAIPAVEEANIEGRLQAKGKVSGALTDLLWQMRGTIERCSFDGVRAESLEYAITDTKFGKSLNGKVKLGLVRNNTRVEVDTAYSLNEGVLTLSRLRMHAPGTKGKGSIRLMMPERELEGNFTLKAGQLSWLGSFLPVTPEGTFRMDSRIEGPFTSPNIFVETASGELETSWFSVGSFTGNGKITGRSSSRDVEANITADDVTTDRATLETLTLTMSGQPKDGYTLEVQTRGKAVHPFKADIEGKIRVDKSEQVVQLNSGNVTYANVPVRLSKGLTVRRGEDSLIVRSKGIELGGGRLNLALRKTDEKITGKARIKDLRLERSIVSDKVASLTGKANGELRIGGSLNEPQAELTVELADVSIPQHDTNGAGLFNGRLRVFYEQARLGGTLEISNSTGDTVKAEGHLPVRLSLKPFRAEITGKLRAKADVNANLASFSPLFLPPSQRLSGDITGKLDVSGPPQSPSWQGHIRLEDGVYENAATGTVLQALQGRIEVRDRNFKMTTFSATDTDEGVLTGSGAFDVHENGVQGDFSVELEEMRLIQTQTVDGTVDGELSFHMTGGGPRLEGNLRIAPVELRIPEPRPKGMQGIRLVEPSEQADGETETKLKAAPSFLDNLILDVEVTLPDRCFIRGRGLDAEWQGNLHVSGTAAQPEIGGSVTVVRGHVDFLTKRFGLAESIIRFQSESPPRPMLDITGVNRRRDLTIRLRATGPVDDPDITVESDPAYPRDEILARLLFDRELREITPLQAVQLALAVRTLTGKGGNITEKLRQSIGVDELDVRTTEEGETVAGVGKYLTEDVYFRVEQAVNGETTQVSVEVELTPHFSVETRTGTMTEGIDLKWRYRY